MTVLSICFSNRFLIELSFTVPTYMIWCECNVSKGYFNSPSYPELSCSVTMEGCGSSYALVEEVQWR